MLCIGGMGAQEHGVCDMSAVGSDEPPAGEPLEHEVPQASTCARTLLPGVLEGYRMRRTDAHLVFGELFEGTVGRWHKRPRFGDG